MVINIKEELKSIGLGLLWVILSITFILIFKLNTIQIIIYLIAIQLILAAYKFIRTKTYPDAKKLSINCLVIVMLVCLFSFLSKLGIFGYILGIIVTSSVIIGFKYKKVQEVKWYIETMLFGKPLKDYIKAGEKPPKIKISS